MTSLSRIYDVEIGTDSVFYGKEDGSITSRPRILDFPNQSDNANNNVVKAYTSETLRLRLNKSKNLLLSGSASGEVDLWKIEKREEENSGDWLKKTQSIKTNNDNEVYSIWYQNSSSSTTSSEDVIGVAIDDCVKWIDLEKNEIIRSVIFPSNNANSRCFGGSVRNPTNKNYVFDACFSDANKLTAVATSDGTMPLVNVDGQIVATKKHGNDALTSCFASSSHLFFSASICGEIKVWDIRSTASSCLQVLLKSNAKQKNQPVFGCFYCEDTDVLISWEKNGLFTWKGFNFVSSEFAKNNNEIYCVKLWEGGGNQKNLFLVAGSNEENANTLDYCCCDDEHDTCKKKQKIGHAPHQQKEEMYLVQIDCDGNIKRL